MTGPPPSEKKALGARVRGRVQGVGYRYWARSAARALGVTGLVRNEPDGSVTVEAEGEDAQLRALLTALRRGPPAARVEAVEESWLAWRGRWQGFDVEF